VKANSKINLHLFLGISLTLVLLLSPLPVFGRVWLNQTIEYLLGPITELFVSNFFGQSQSQYGFYTDSLNYALLLAICIVISIMVFGFVQLFFQNLKILIQQFINTFLIYFLAWIFAVYGAYKLFGIQFPEPNSMILQMTLEDLGQDLAFWSLMGINKTLTIAIGLIEILIAVALLFKKTRSIGLFLMLIALAQIVLINFAFDISVKIFSALLLLAVIYLSYPFLCQTLKWFMKLKTSDRGEIQTLKMSDNYRKPLKFLILSWIVISALTPIL